VVRDRQRNDTGLVRALRTGGDLRPLYLAHPAGGDTAVYRDLVELLDSGRPCFGLDRITDIEPVTDRAIRYAELIEGGSVLGGWSFGGVLAFETARVLQAKGIDTDLVVLLDSGLPLPLGDDDTEQKLLARRMVKFGDYLTATYGRPVSFDGDYLSTLEDEGQLDVVIAAMRDAGVLDEMGPAILRHQITSHLDTRARESYQPGPYSGRVVLFRAFDPAPWAVREPRFLREDHTLGWAEHCANLTVIPTPGHHLNLLDPPNVRTLADHLRRLMR
jgi:thioesterase domain-containing protein